MKHNISENLALIAQSEGEGFSYEQEEIEQEYAFLEDNEAGLAIKILSVIGGFLATLFFLGSIVSAIASYSEAGLLVFGLLSIGFAIWLNVTTSRLIIDTISVSTFAAGFSMIGVGFAMLEVDENFIGIAFIIIALATLSITQNFILSFISILFINGSFLFLIVVNSVYSLIHFYNALLLVLLTYFLLQEAKFFTGVKPLSKLYDPIRIGLVDSVISGLVFVATKNIFEINIYYIWLSSVVIFHINIYVVSLIIKLIGVTNAQTKAIIYILSVLFLIPSVFSPAISGALLIVLLCYMVNYKTGLYLGIIAFIYFEGQYYYDLNYTLLVKSMIMFGSGIIFLSFYYFMHKKLDADEKI